MCAACAAYAATTGQSAFVFIIISEVQTGVGGGEQRDKHGNEKFYGKSQNKNKLKCFFIPVLFICSISDATVTGFTCCQ